MKYGKPEMSVAGQLFVAMIAVVPEPITIASAQARRNPMTKRSASFRPLMSFDDWTIGGAATTPSRLPTKFATSRGSSKPSDPP